MSGTALEKVRSEALKLPEAERAELAYNLVVSLLGGQVRSRWTRISAESAGKSVLLLEKRWTTHPVC